MASGLAGGFASGGQEKPVGNDNTASQLRSAEMASHARSEAVPAGTGDRSTLNAISSMENQASASDAKNSAVSQMLGSFSIEGGDKPASPALPKGAAGSNEGGIMSGPPGSAKGTGGGGGGGGGLERANLAGTPGGTHGTAGGGLGEAGGAERSMSVSPAGGGKHAGMDAPPPPPGAGASSENQADSLGRHPVDRTSINPKMLRGAPENSGDVGGTSRLEGGDRDALGAVNDYGMDKAITMPSRQDLLTKPTSQLKQAWAQNAQNLNDVVAQNLPYLLANRVGAHGTGQSKMDSINNQQSGKDGGLCVAVTKTIPTDAADWISQTGRVLRVGDEYATNVKNSAEPGHIALVSEQNYDNFASKELNRYTDLTCLMGPIVSYVPAGDSQVSGQSNSGDASKTGPLAQPAEIGQIKDSVNKANFDQKVLCWMDRSNWSQYDKPFSFAKTNEEATRNTLAGALQEQAMLIAMLDKLNIHVPTKALDQDQSTSESGTSSNKDQSTFFGRITSFLSGGV